MLWKIWYDFFLINIYYILLNCKEKKITKKLIFLGILISFLWLNNFDFFNI